MRCYARTFLRKGEEGDGTRHCVAGYGERFACMEIEKCFALIRKYAWNVGVRGDGGSAHEMVKPPAECSR